MVGSSIGSESKPLRFMCLMPSIRFVAISSQMIDPNQLIFSLIVINHLLPHTLRVLLPDRKIRWLRCCAVRILNGSLSLLFSFI